MMNRFRDRREAGRLLGERLQPRFGGQEDVLVLALPRGGVPVAYELALAIGAPLDVFLVRKLGVPGHEELAMGAIAEGGVRVLNPSVLALIELDDPAIDQVAAREERELRRRAGEYRGERAPPEVRGRTVILVDDGLATGATMRAAVAAVRAGEPARIIVAVPVAAAETCDQLAPEVDEIICLRTPEPFHAVGIWYEVFDQTTDGEVRALLASAASGGSGRASGSHAASGGGR
jgi:putative phosphoribosyl transferase